MMRFRLLPCNIESWFAGSIGRSDLCLNFSSYLLILWDHNLFTVVLGVTVVNSRRLCE